MPFIYYNKKYVKVLILSDIVYIVDIVGFSADLWGEKKIFCVVEL